MLSLRHLLIMLAAIGLLPLAAVGGWSIHAASQYQQREQERSMLDLARALSSAADAELDSAVDMLTSMSRSPELQRGDLPAFYQSARALAKAQPEWLGVILTDERGNMLFRTMADYGAPPIAIADPASLTQVLESGQPVVGHITRGERGRAAFPVRIALSDQDGKTYTLTAVIRPDRMVNVIERQQVPAGAVISVMDTARAVVARSKEQSRSVGSVASPTLLDMLQTNGAEGIGITRTIEGEEVVTAYTTLSHYGWLVAIGRPAGLLKSSALERFGVYGAGIALSLLACSALASLLASRLLTTIQGLQRGAAALGAGAPLQLRPSPIREIQLIGVALEEAERQRTRQESERKLLLDSLNQALASNQAALEQARQAGRAKDEFLAVLGHELRNPLSPIVTSLDLMDRRDEPASRRERAVMRRQVSHLRRLVDDLLDVSRITSGKLQLDARPVNLAEVVRHAVAAAPDKQINVSAPPAVWVLGDDSRLTQVINNLLSNAARFGSSATQVSLSVEDGRARLLVSDNGIGMSADLLARVFEPFLQAPQSLARRTGGLGLGLAIVRKIVELHGGQVCAHSDGDGRGSRFDVWLPLGQAPHDQATLAPPRSAAGLDVLLVDDNADAATTGAALLELLGHRVRTAHTAGAALDLVHQRLPDVAILDIGLPDIDGYALATAIRRRAQGAPLRLVALTGYGQKEDVERAASTGFDLHLTKPASVDDLQRATAPLAVADTPQS